ncbi:unannotated protein [freshwater metagenome]|uniref:Unannotated protein n=1 Tax=freshwater metagenome TaxID=449393 RepID=A0A6J6Q7U7_9ZZZZ|nr:hypothetical protein [Actinomycetota bacterium]
MMTGVPALRLLGFPVKVKPGFLAFLALVMIWNPGVGWKFAIAITIFSLIHELGHATAAKRLGAQPEIALDFLAGSTRYTPPRPITPIERAWVAVSGPAVEIVLGLVVLGVMRVNPFDVPQVFDSQVAGVVWIAGPVFGFLNLLPILPLDGGHVLSGVLESIWPSRGGIVAIAFSAAVTLAVGVVTFLEPAVRWLAPFALMLLVLQIWPLVPQRTRGTRRHATRPAPAEPGAEPVASET